MQIASVIQDEHTDKLLSSRCASHNIEINELCVLMVHVQAAETLASAVSQEGCRLKSLSLNYCCVGQRGVLNLLQSLQGLAFAPLEQ